MTNLRKAAILLRSADAETAAALLGQLSPAEANAIRAAIQSLGHVDAEEQADVVAEFRHVGLAAAEDPRRTVELDISIDAQQGAATQADRLTPARPFDFLENARVESLVPYLAREHGQTVAVVLSYLPPERAADVLAALPPTLQAATIERLTNLGETDPASLEVLERELADWMARQHATRARGDNRPDAAAVILAAANDSTRTAILANLLKSNRELAERLAPSPSFAPRRVNTNGVVAESRGACAATTEDSAVRMERPAAPPVASDPPFSPRIAFDDLSNLSNASLAELLAAVDANVWVLALAAAKESFVERIAGQMSRSTARAFRKRLRQLGPTRLRDLESAQQEIVAAALRIMRQKSNREAAAARVR